jgi:hypothetical protein
MYLIFSFINFKLNNFTKIENISIRLTDLQIFLFGGIIKLYDFFIFMLLDNFYFKTLRRMGKKHREKKKNIKIKYKNRSI